MNTRVGRRLRLAGPPGSAQAACQAASLAAAIGDDAEADPPRASRSPACGHPGSGSSSSADGTAVGAREAAGNMNSATVLPGQSCWASLGPAPHLLAALAAQVARNLRPLLGAVQRHQLDEARVLLRRKEHSIIARPRQRGLASAPPRSPASQRPPPHACCALTCGLHNAVPSGMVVAVCASPYGPSTETPGQAENNLPRLLNCELLGVGWCLAAMVGC
jgi:hypothetical protein